MQARIAQIPAVIFEGNGFIAVQQLHDDRQAVFQQWARLRL